MLNPRRVIVAFDVNGTLTQERIRWLFHSINRETCRVLVWSTLGVSYGKKMCQRLGLTPDDYVTKHSVEVDLAFDDYPESITTAREVIGV